MLEQRIDADLAAGRHAELVGELQALVTRHPLRERLRGQLMLALYRSARQAEALDAYRAARRELSEELGLEPSEELKRLEQAILRQDPALELPRRRPEPLLASPGRSGIAALAEGAGLLVVGLSERWRHEGLGRVRAELAECPPAPTVLVRRGTRPGGLAPAESRTRFRWSLTGAAS